MKLLLVLAGIVALALALLVVPIPEAAGTRPHDEFAEEDSLFADILGLDIHYKIVGNGEPVFILLHGFGASLFSWRYTMSPLSEYGRVVAFDRPAFGFTERQVKRRYDGANPYSPAGQVESTVRLMDYLGIEEAILIGHSAGAGVVVDTILTYPERVSGAVLVAPAVFTTGPANRFWLSIMRSPWGKKYGPLFVRRVGATAFDALGDMWYDPEKLTEGVIEGYKKPLSVRGWDKALWELTLSSGERTANRELMSDIDIPVLIVMGSDDTIIPLEDGEKLCDFISSSTCVVISETGHLPHEEAPREFIKSVLGFLEGNYLISIKKDASN